MIGRENIQRSRLISGGGRIALALTMGLALWAVSAPAAAEDPDGLDSRVTEPMVLHLSTAQPNVDGSFSVAEPSVNRLGPKEEAKITGLHTRLWWREAGDEQLDLLWVDMTSGVGTSLERLSELLWFVKGVHQTGLPVVLRVEFGDVDRAYVISLLQEQVPDLQDHGGSLLATLDRNTDGGPDGGIVWTPVGAAVAEPVPTARRIVDLHVTRLRALSADCDRGGLEFYGNLTLGGVSLPLGRLPESFDLDPHWIASVDVPADAVTIRGSIEVGDDDADCDGGSTWSTSHRTKTVGSCASRSTSKRAPYARSDRTAPWGGSSGRLKCR